MNGMQLTLEIVLVLLLGATLFHALRLERALGVLKRDRATLESLVAGFNGATRQAQIGVDRLQEAADGAGRQMARQIDTVASLKEDLLFLIERGDRLADRMDGLVRSGRAAAPAAPLGSSLEQFHDPLPDRRPHANAAQLRANSGEAPPRGTDSEPLWTPPPELARTLDLAGQLAGVTRGVPAEPVEEGAARMRSQAERDLLKALRMAR